MIEVQNITDEPIQIHIIIFDEGDITLTLRFLPKTEMWFFDVEYNGKSTKGLKLSVGSLHMVSQNQPFDFEVSDNSGSGVDPFKADDFSSGRCSLYMLERDDMVSIRYGAEV